MSVSHADVPALTEEQQAVVDQPVDAVVLVTAGAGTGKTHTLLRRLERLAAEEDLHAQDVLVLTFSRSAVRDLRERLSRQGHQTRFLRARTFDSWALDLLMQVDEQGGWEHQSFDRRIEAAREKIEQGAVEELYGEGLRHVVIDEVQDLVGARRELVQTLLANSDSGFTVVGDPAQSIYGFTLGDDRSVKGETGRFFVWLREEFGEELTELGLTHNFRVRTSEARTALEHESVLQTSAMDGSPMERRLHAALRDSLRTTMDFGGLDELGLNGLRDYQGSTAILCRTNAQALVLSERLWAGGVEHRLRRGARDRAAPAWLASLVRNVEGTVLSRGHFAELLPRLHPAPQDDPDQLWRLLRRVGARRGDPRTLELHHLRRALHTGRLPDELTAEPESRIVVSSMHRAKGLEFDRVIVVDDSGQRRKDRQQDEAGVAEEARLLYVAMTRPRHDLFWLEPQTEGPWPGFDKRTHRWYRGSYRKGRRNGIEVTGRDVHTEHPGGVRDFEDSASELQGYLANEVSLGDAVSLCRAAPQPSEEGSAPAYLLVHQGRTIATASSAFREALYRLLTWNKNWRQWTWPAAVTELRIDAVESVAGNEAAGARAGLGEHGVWLAPRVVGLGRFDWGDRTEEGNADAGTR